MLTIVEFDFEQKTERKVTLGLAKQAMRERRFVWIDLDTTDRVTAGKILDELEIVSERVKNGVLQTGTDVRLTKYPTCLKIVLTTCECEGEKLVASRIVVVIGKGFFLTAHDGDRRFLQDVRRDYGEDFLHFAKSPGFLVFEIWDHLRAEYIAARDRFEARVAEVQEELMGEADEKVFTHVAQLGSEILRFRNILVASRSVLSDLASRKTVFVSEETQAYLENLVGVFQRVLADLVVDREVLTDALSLYMSMQSRRAAMTGQRTNQQMNRLTVVSLVFLPLTFLCGVYGMNFANLPELQWKFGYLYFWVVTTIVVGALVWFLRKSRLL